VLTPDMRAVIRSAHLCFAATVTPDGRPNVSPKGTIRVWDDTQLFFLDIASPGTRTNLAHAPWLELNVVDYLSRRGYRFSGRATLHLPDSVVYADGVRRVYDATLPADPAERTRWERHGFVESGPRTELHVAAVGAGTSRSR